MSLTVALLGVFLAQAQAPAGPPAPKHAECPQFADPIPRLPYDIPSAAARYRYQIISHVQEGWAPGHATVAFPQIERESRFNCDVENARTKAGGIAQFMPGTAYLMQKKYFQALARFCANRGGCPFNPDWALHAMALLDKENFVRHGTSSGDDRYGFALAEYNGSPDSIAKETAYCRTVPGCNPGVYFGGVREVCGSAVPSRTPRSAEDCVENKAYAYAILFDLRPKYKRWLVGQ